MSWILLLLLTLGLVACSPLRTVAPNPSVIAAQKRQSDAQSPGEQPDGSCVIEGNPDFYGLGIRAGVYLQYVTAFGANLLLTENIDGNLVTNTVFLLALFIAMAVATAQRTVQTVEIVVLLQLSFGFLFTILSIWGHRIRAHLGEQPVRFPLAGSFFRLTLATALSIYGVWFWFLGTHQAQPEGDCATYIFLFARADVAGAARIFFQVQSALILVGYGILFARELLMIVCFVVLVSAWTSVVALFTVIFSARAIWLERQRRLVDPTVNLDISELTRKKIRGYQIVSVIPKYIWMMVIQWSRIAGSLAWKQLNGKQSAGSNRPRLELYLITFIDLWILVARFIVQVLCLFIFNWCPPIDMPPLIVHPVVRAMSGKEYDTTLWDRAEERITKLYNSQSTQNVIYTINALCVVWTIVSVELTLIWNNVEGVYSVQSTGQLIPFIIGLTGFVGLLHGLSVQRSAVYTTDVLMSLLDVEPKQDGAAGSFGSARSRSASRSSSSLSLSASERAEEDEIYSLHDGQEAVFWQRHVGRRHSMDIIRPEDIERDLPKAAETDNVLERRDFHLHHMSDYDMLVLVYGKRNLEEHSITGNRKVWFVKDFRRSDAAQNVFQEFLAWSNGGLEPDTFGRPSRSVNSPDFVSEVSDIRNNVRRSRSLSSRRSQLSGSYDSPSHSRSDRSGTGRRHHHTSSPESISSSRSRRRPAFEGLRYLPSCIKHWLTACLLCFSILFGSIYKPVNLLFSWLGKLLWSRCKSAARTLLQRYRDWLTPLIASMQHKDNENPKSDGSNKEFPGSAPGSAPHVQEKPFSRGVDTQSIKDAFSLQSFPALSSALCTAGATICRGRHWTVTANNIENLNRFLQEVKAIRVRKRDGDIGKTVQHKETRTKWLEMIPTDFLTTLAEELKSRSSKKRPGWETTKKPRREQQQLEEHTRRFSWAPGEFGEEIIDQQAAPDARNKRRRRRRRLDLSS